MADIVGMDPERIARLRDPKRLETVNPERVWDMLPPPEEGTIVDIGAGVGFVTLPFARRCPGVRLLACDVLPGMLELLAESAREEGLANVETVLMEEETQVPLPDAAADLVIMLQVHHELSDAPALLADCHRLLRGGGALAIIDWKGEDTGKGPPPARRVSESRIREELAAAGFRDVAAHPLFTHHNFLTAVK